MKIGEFKIPVDIVGFNHEATQVIEGAVSDYRDGEMSKRDLESLLVVVGVSHLSGVVRGILAGLLGWESEEVKAFVGASNRLAIAHILLEEGMLKDMGESWYEQSVEALSDEEVSGED